MCRKRSSLPTPQPAASDYHALLDRKVVHRSGQGYLTGEAAEDFPSHPKPTPRRRREGARFSSSVILPPALPLTQSLNGSYNSRATRRPSRQWSSVPSKCLSSQPLHPTPLPICENPTEDAALRGPTNLRGGAVSSGTRLPTPRRTRCQPECLQEVRGPPRTPATSSASLSTHPEVSRRRQSQRHLDWDGDGERCLLCGALRHLRDQQNRGFLTAWGLRLRVDEGSQYPALTPPARL